MKQFALLIGFVTLSVCLQAQELWLGAGVKTDVSDRISLGVEDQVRFREYVEEWRMNLTQFGGEYSVLPWMKVGAKYRYSVVHRKDNEHRVMGDVKLKTDLGKSDWKVDYRLRYQFEWEADGEDHLYLLRNKVRFTKKFNKLLKTSYAGELFHAFSPEFLPNRYRLTAVVETRLLKIFDFETFVRYQREIEEAESTFGDEPDEATILGINLIYKIPLSKKN